ncbi:UDP-glucose 6-dehydrogenase [Euryarchaeota archaeon SM23-78]|nr:MAG: UDP-glucose 6-dehydrogenase [Euryarchaeota archaeon SM23-78]MBW3000370.1 UDP-glucose/GDP-mannose dehydrogenase family protein [Candidatus Woesearchaeota archaeon]
MKLLCIGSGYVGLVSGTCFADLGNDVICLDIDEKKVETLNKGIIPIYEPGLKELVERNLKQGRLKFTIDTENSIKQAEIIFICVGTPPKANGEADMSFVYNAAESIGKHIVSYKIVVTKSTVPVGTAEKIKRIINAELKKRKKKIDFDVVSNPEFLREGAAVKDFQNPDRIIIGTSSEKAKETLARLYKPISRATKPIMFTTEKNAELIKYASNAMLATRISFMNELSHLCEEIGADIKAVAKGMGLDTRIGSRFLQAGCGYGGSCFPKDVKAIAQILEQYGFTSNLLRTVDYINERQKRSLVPKLKKFIPKLEGKTIAIWGLSFKPRTDDIREAPCLTVIDQLLKEYAKIKAYDPEAMENAKKVLKKGVVFAKNAYEALKDADALIILTEWDEFREPDFAKIKKLMKQHIIIDGRNIYDPIELKKLGFKYKGVGR